MDEPTYTTIAENWAHFLMVDMPPGAPEVQRDAMKRAFYAGAASAIHLGARAALDAAANGNSAPLERLRDELDAFVARGKEQSGA